MTDRPNQPSGTPGGAAAGPAKRRRWMWALIGVLAALIILVWAAPYIASTAAARGAIVGTLNDTLKGTFRIDDISLSWFGPCTVRGLKLADTEGREVLTVEEVKFVPGLWGLVFSWENFQWVGADSARTMLYVDADGGISLIEALSLIEPEPEKPLPELHGTVKVRNAWARLVLHDGRTLEVSRLAADVTIDTLDAISGDIEVEVAGKGGLKAEKFSVTGLLRDGKIDPLHAAVDIDVRTTQDIELKSVLALVTDQAVFGGKVRLKKGKFNGSVLKPEADFDLVVSGFSAAGRKGADVQPVDVALTGNFSVSGESSAVSADAPDARTVTAEMTLSGEPGLVKANASWPLARNPLTVRPSHEELTSAVLAGETSALPEFSFDATGDVDLARLASAAPGVLNIREDVKVASGRLKITDLSVRSGRKSPAAKGRIELMNVTALSGGETIRFEPATVDFEAVIEPGKGLRIPRADVKSAFATVHAAGDLDGLRAAFDADLAKLHRQLGRVFKMGTFELAGTTGGTLTVGRKAENIVEVELKDVRARALRWSRRPRLLELDSAEVSAGAVIRLDKRSAAGQYSVKKADVALETARFANLRYKDEKRDLNTGSIAVSGRGVVFIEKRPRTEDSAGSPLTDFSLAKLVVNEGNIDVGETLSASGSGTLDLKTGGFEATLNVHRADIAKAAAKAWGLGVELGELARCGGSLRAGNVRLAREAPGRPIILPGTGTAVIRSPTLDGRPLGVEKVTVGWNDAGLSAAMNRLTAGSLKLDSEIASASLAEADLGWGNPPLLNGSVRLRADVGRAMPVLARLTRTRQAAALSGQLDWSGKFQTTPPGALAGTVIAAKTTGGIKDFAVRTGGRWQRLGDLTFSEDAEVMLKGGDIERIRVTRGHVRMPGKLVGAASGAFVPSIGALDAELEIEEADVAGLVRTLLDPDAGLDGVFAFLKPLRKSARELRRYAGNLQLKTTLKRAASDKPFLATGSAVVKNAQVDRAPLTGNDITLEWRDVKFGSGVAEGRWLKMSAGAAAASAAKFKLSLDPGTLRQAKGEIRLMANLARTAAAVRRVTPPWLPHDMPQLAGRLDWSGSLASDGTNTVLTGGGAVKHLRVGEGSRAFSDRQVTFTNHVDINPKTKTLTLRDVKVTATAATVRLAGTVREYDTRRVLNLRGGFRGTWERLMPLVCQFVPETRGNVTLYGPAVGAFTVEGTANDPKIKPAWRGVASVANAGWTSAKIQAVSGVTFGGATISGTLKDGILRVPVTEISAGDGKVRAGGVLDLRTEPATLYVPGKLQVIENFRFDEEFGKKFLNSFNPIFGGNVQGLASVMVQDVTTPLDGTLKRMTGRGRLDLHDLKIESRGFLEQLVGLIGLGGDGTYLVPHTGTDFVIRNGRIYYKDFVVPMRKNYDLIFSGSVGLADDRLDMVVSVPLTGNLLRKQGAEVKADDMARILSIRVDFKITGTRKNPKFTPQFNLGKLVQKAMRTLMLERIGGILKPK